jgi:hypothetical protein
MDIYDERTCRGQGSEVPLWSHYRDSRGFVFGKNVASEADKIFKRPGSNIEAGHQGLSVAEV